MATKKFKKNLNSLVKKLDADELVDFLINKNAFNEDFIKRVTELNSFKKCDIFNLDINKIKEKIQYVVNYKDKKINVNISENDVFSYNDDEYVLKIKLNKYIENEEYEKADILNNYMKKIEIYN